MCVASQPFVWSLCVQVVLVYTVYHVCCRDKRQGFVAVVCSCFKRGRGELQLSQMLILCDRDWRGPSSNVTTLTPENPVNGCWSTLMNRHSQESNTSLISACSIFQFCPALSGKGHQLCQVSLAQPLCHSHPLVIRCIRDEQGEVVISVFRWMQLHDCDYIQINCYWSLS